ncbi:MAG: hypothetical protein JKX69_09135 [Rhodobacteraceae bacterium]|nr:hypothetical protein [Paracoccaceae bacterium]
MIRFLVAALTALLAVPAAAQTVTIRSGDHGQFTRLVLTLPSTAEWRFGRQSAGEYLLDLGEDVTYDPVRIFDLISRDRLAGYDLPGPGLLSLELGCDNCHAEVFSWQEDWLVIDIKDGPARPGSANENPLILAPEVLAFGETPAPEMSHVLPVLMARQNRSASLPLPNTFSATPPSGIVAQTERAISESLARAATLGLVTLPENGLLPPVEPDLALSDALEQARDDVGPNGPGLAMRTSLDRDPPTPHNMEPPDACLDDRFFDLGNWVDTDKSFALAIAERRDSLTGEFDRYQNGATLALARTYLYFGFGAEARVALQLNDEQTLEERVLATVALIVDQDPRAHGTFSDQIECARPVALWAALAQGSLDGMGNDVRTAVTLGFRTLPAPLRGHLGSRLAQLFLDAGEPTLAEALQLAAMPAVTGGDQAAELTGANIILEIQGVEAAIDELHDIVEDSANLSPEAMLRLIDLTLEEHDVPTGSEIALLAALRFEMQGAPVEAELAIAETRALIAAGRYHEAIDLTHEEINGFRARRKAELQDQAVAEMTARAEVAVFLDHAMSHLPAGTTASTENDVATRLLELGFAERASAILLGEANRGALNERRYLRAEAALAMGQTERVITELAGMRDPRAAGLIAQAHSNDGDHVAALAALSLPDGALPEQASLWRAGAWAQLTHEGDQLLQDAASAILTAQNTDPDGTPLAVRHALLADTGETRALVNSLLDRFTIPDEN